MSPSIFARVLLCVGLSLACLPASAHRVGISRGEYRADGSTVHAQLTFARPEIVAAVPGLDADGDGQLSPDEIASGRDVLATAMDSGLQVRAGTQRCRGEFEQAELAANDGLVVGLRFFCREAPPAFSIRLSLLSSLSLGHRHLAEVVGANSGSAAVTHVVYEASPDFDVVAMATTASNDVAGPLFKLGIEHILTGFDHLLFLFGVVLIGGRLRDLVLAVTAFTLAHSVTLGLATLGFWAPSPNLVEPAIALSIVYVGVENWFAKDAARRWLLTFPFGLIHGFGFAGALREIALPSAQVPLALLSFNLGVEAGQIVVLALVLPILAWLRRRDWFVRQGVRSASAMVALAGLAWFAQRVGWVF